nr:MAG TPA: hypothetical protein [Caudoviricetes sp.]
MIIEYIKSIAFNSFTINIFRFYKINYPPPFTIIRFVFR